MKKIAPTLGFVLLLSGGTLKADVVHLDDVIVDGSLCIGLDCVNGENFGFDTLRLKENNLRINFEDTSSAAAFPSNDWRITINDSSNGGGNYFAIEDSTAGRQVFRVDAGAPANSLRVDSQGDVGIGTANAVVELHVVDGDSPTMRLEQDGSSGFTPQTWDVAGNEANFFIRDVTNGSTLPFRIKPGAPTNSISIDANGHVGFGIQTPQDDLHLSDNGPARFRLSNTTKSVTPTEDPDWIINSNGSLRFSAGSSESPEMTILANGDTGFGTTSPQDRIHITTEGPSRLRLSNTTKASTATEDPDWSFNSNGTLRVSAGNDTAELVLAANGNLTILGSLTTAGGVTPDYVFKPGYDLMDLENLREYIDRENHLPNIPSADEIAQKGAINMTEMQMKLLEKIEELTLYTLDQHKTIKALNDRISKLEKNQRPEQHH